MEEIVSTNSHKDHNFEALYFLTGFVKSSLENDGCRTHQFKKALASELDEKKADFDELISCQISGLINKDDPTLRISFSSIDSEEQLKKDQRNTGIINDDLKIRLDLRDYYQPILKKKRDEYNTTDDSKNKKMKVNEEEKPPIKKQNESLGKTPQSNRTAITNFFKPSRKT